MHFKFGAYRDEAMRDWLVCGLRDEDTQKRLLSEEDLTFVHATEIARSQEAAQLNVQQLKETSDVAVKTVSSRVEQTVQTMSALWKEQSQFREMFVQTCHML